MTRPPGSQPESIVSRGVSAASDRERGALKIAAAGCGSCHELPGIPNASGSVGPPLDSLSRRIYLAGRLRNTPTNLASWLKDPQHYAPGSAMPNLNLSNSEVADIAAYLNTLN